MHAIAWLHTKSCDLDKKYESLTQTLIFFLVDMRGIRVSSAKHCAVNEVNHTFGLSPTTKLKKGKALKRNANNVRLSYIIAFRKQASLLLGGREGNRTPVQKTALRTFYIFSLHFVLSVLTRVNAL